MPSYKITRKSIVSNYETFRNTFFPILGNHGEFYGEPGDRSYQLLSYLSTQFTDQNIIVWDAYNGLSSLALSLNSKNYVHGFTTNNLILPEIKEQSSLSFYNIDLANSKNRDAWKSLILSSALIFIDRSPHNGKEEYEFFKFLQENMYNGIVIAEQIWSMKDMRDQFWAKIPDERRCDVSLLANHSGTGIFWFSPEIEVVVEHDTISPYKTIKEQWTLVTAYFNLTKCADASAEIKARNAEYYFQHAVGTLSLPYNMVIYCDAESLPRIQAIRPTLVNTKYEIRVFDDFKFNPMNPDEPSFEELREKIIYNRIQKPYQFDNRNTASYYLFCMSRYLMMKEVILSNPFQSTHFCWINFCMERMGYRNLLHLEECLGTFREKFSTCYIDYVPQPLVENTAEYFQRGRCGMCSGFFTGSKFYMFNVCSLIIQKFVLYLNQGYGHADEQLYSPVYFENPHLFDQYFGDYTEMITNYSAIYERSREPLSNFIRNSFLHGNYAMCKKACEVLLSSIAKQKCTFSSDDMQSLEYYFTQSYIQLQKY